MTLQEIKKGMKIKINPIFAEHYQKIEGRKYPLGNGELTVVDMNGNSVFVHKKGQTEIEPAWTVTLEEDGTIWNPCFKWKETVFTAVGT